MHEGLDSNSDRYRERELATSIFDAAETMFHQNLATQSATYAMAKSGVIFGAHLRATLRGIETLRNTVGSEAGNIVEQESYNKLLVIDHEETGERIVYGTSHLLTEHGATARMFSLYILQEDVYRLLAVYTSGAGDVWTRDSVEVQLGEFERHAYEVVSDEYATTLGPILNGMLREGTTLEGELAQLHYSLMNDGHLSADDFIDDLRNHFNRKRESSKFGLMMHGIAGEMSIKRMEMLLDHLSGSDLTISVFD